MDQGLATVVAAVLALLGVPITAWVTIVAARISARSRRRDAAPPDHLPPLPPLPPMPPPRRDK